MKGFKNCFGGIVLMALCGLWGCNKNANDTAPVIKTTQLNVVNMVSDIGSIDYYVNGTRQNTTSAIPFSLSTGYAAVAVGAQQYQFKNDTLDRVLLADVSLKLDSGVNYTIVVSGQQRNGTIAPILMVDSARKDSTTDVTAKVRFIQASPGAGAYDVTIGDTVSFKNKSFKAFTGFVKTGSGIKKLKVFAAGSTTPIINTTVTLQKSTYYDLYIKGSSTGTGNNAFGTVLLLSR